MRGTPEAYIAVAGLAALALAFHQISRRNQRVKQAEAEGETRLVSALNGVSQCFGLFGQGQICLSGNSGFLRLFKLTPEKARGRLLSDLMSNTLALPLKDRDEIAKRLGLTTAARKKKARQNLCVELAGGCLMEFVFAPTPDGFSFRAEDATKRRAEELQVERMARTDDVTGMANRAAFRELLERASASASESPFAIFMIDLDRFKQVNDTMGHAAGDKLLGRMAKRLADLVGEGEEVARRGGDEFVVLIRTNRAAAALFAARIVEALWASLIRSRAPSWWSAPRWAWRWRRKSPATPRT
ncbi:diguanylate cyclase (GGDEF)-like protein [Rhodoblastus sphagnicola]|nr:GGDEF domain-containing protein [Rhodoblastus sphagnicola]MBB4199501.1 diguanylate cyclase (GGDEF)-like protein [Rhodoblastus sphagnicola]